MGKKRAKKVSNGRLRQIREKFARRIKSGLVSDRTFRKLHKAVRAINATLTPKRPRTKPKSATASRSMEGLA